MKTYETKDFVEISYLLYHEHNVVGIREEGRSKYIEFEVKEPRTTELLVDLRNRTARVEPNKLQEAYSLTKEVIYNQATPKFN